MSTGYIFRRLIYMALNLWLVVSVAFFLFRLMPGDPVAAQVGELGDIAVKENLTEYLGLNEPIIVQYGKYIGNLVQGDFEPRSRKRLRSRTSSSPQYFSRIAIGVRFKVADWGSRKSLSASSQRTREGFCGLSAASDRAIGR